MIKCVTETCVAKIPVSVVETWEGKCPRCRNVEQKAFKPVSRKKPEGYVICRSKGCGAQLPKELAEKNNGVCPKCVGVKQEAVKRNRTQKFTSLEEFNAAKQA